MAHLLIALVHDPTVRSVPNELTRQVGAAADLYAAFLSDSVALAHRVAHANVMIVAQRGSLLRERMREVSSSLTVTVPDVHPTTIAHLVAEALVAGPVLLFGGDLPHLPIWRLRDTLTHLEGGADVVIGPGERGDWYLIGLRSAHPALLRALPSHNERPDDLCIAAATHGLRVEHLPPWYTLSTLADLDRLTADLRTMPPDFARHTRKLLNGDGIQAMAVGA